jgi:hypothetical protein
MKIAILQPAYLPWLGFFDLMDQVDTFVLLDNVQFEKRSWQQRNRIKSPTGLLWLTVPVKSRGLFEQRICEVGVGESEFWRDHLRSIEMNYRRAPFFADYFEECGEVFRQSGKSLLVDLTSSLIVWLASKLGVTAPVVRASRLQESGKRTELLRDLCIKLNASEYRSPLGSAEYLLEDMQLMRDANVAVFFQNYAHPEYKQLFPPFLPYASALDLLFNEGPRSLEIVRSGRREPFLPEQVAAQLGQRAVHS